MDEEVQKDIIINVQTNYDEALAQLVKYRKEVEYLSNEKKRYKEMLDAEMITQDEYVKAIAETTAEQKNASASAASWEKVVRNSLKADKEKAGSMEQMKAQLSNLTQAYNNLSKAERQSAKGTELKDKIKGISDELKGNEAEMGLFQRNVGNYESALKNLGGNLKGVIGPIGGMAGGIDAVGLSTKTALGPLGLLLSVIQILIDAFKAFDPVMDKIEQGMAALNAIYSTFKDGVLSLITGQKSLTEVVSGMGYAMSKAAKDAIELTKAQQDLDDVIVINSVNAARYTRQINELMLQSRDRTKSEQERAALIQQALDLEKKAYAERKYIADQEYENALRAIVIGKNLTEEQVKGIREKGVAYAFSLKDIKGVLDNEVKAVAEAEINKENILNESVSIREKAINRQNVLIEQAEEAAKKSAEATKKRADDAAKLLQDTEALLQGIYKDTEALNSDSIDAAIKAETERVTKILEMDAESRKIAAQEFALEWENRLLAVEEGTRAESDLRTKAAQADYDRLVNMDAATKAALYDSDAEYTNALLKSKRELNKATDEANRKEQEAMVIKLQAARAIGEGFQNIFDAIGESSNELALAAKAIALFNIGLATAEAIAKGVASAQSVPFPGNLAAIATTIGAIMTNIAAAYKIINGLGNDPSSTTQQGGGNNGTSSKVVSATSSTSPATVGYNAGTVPYQAATTGLYSAAATDTVNNQLNDVNLSTQAINLLKNAISSLPRPVVDVRQISDAQNKVEVVEQTRRIG